MNTIKTVLKVLWAVVDAICFTIGLAFLIVVLTSYFSGGKVELSRKGEQVFCFSKDFNKCMDNPKEEKSNEKI